MCGNIGDWASAPPARLFLANITFRVAKLGGVSVAALASLAGAWIAALLPRRRLLTLLELAFEAARRPDLREILGLSPALRAELCSVAIMAPSARADLRLDRPEGFACVDASQHRLSVVRAPMGPRVGTGFMWQGVKRGAWARLLPPVQC